VTLNLVGGTSGVIDVPEILKLRLLSTVLLAQMPDTGMPEVCESLAHLYSYYLPCKGTQVISRQQQEAPARYGVSYVRPSFGISDD
jgi:hypothetical protein